MCIVSYFLICYYDYVITIYVRMYMYITFLELFSDCSLECLNGGVLNNETCTCDCALTDYTGDRCESMCGGDVCVCVCVCVMGVYTYVNTCPVLTLNCLWLLHIYFTSNAHSH